MAEYYPLLAKAVAGLPNSTLETRRAIYERARKALLGQLRALQPPVLEADVEKESQALDVAIARLEAEFSVAEQAPVEAPGITAASGEPLAAKSNPVSPPPINPQPPAPPVTGGGAQPNVVRPRVDNAVPLPNQIQAEKKNGATEPEAQSAAVPASGLSTVKIRPEPNRPMAPQAPGPKQNPKGLWIVLAVIGFIVAGVAVAAWKLRDKPEDLAKLKAAQTQQQQAETNGKIVERAGDADQSKDAKAAASIAAAQAADTATNVPVTYRAAMLVQAPEEQSKVKTYFGTVIWRLDNVSNGPGEPLGTAIHANVDIPEDKLQASVTIQKNLDASLPASHTMTIVFTIQPSSPTGGIKQIGVPQMRKEDSATGESLAGLPVPIIENSFLIGLAQGNATATNLELLKSRQWVDIPILLANGKIAKLTFEKGVAGQRATDDAIASWQTQ